MYIGPSYIIMKNQQITLVRRPKGHAVEADFENTTKDIPELKSGEFLVKNEFISLDPAMRGWMNAGTTYMPGVALGEVMRGFATGKISQSKNENYKVGDYITGLFGVQEYAVSNGKGTTYIGQINEPLSYHLGVLGMPGMTAYFGLLEKGQPKSGETVFISGAAGIVGSTVGQIAKIKGCTVVGTAGSEEKCRYLTEQCGFDVAINYKQEDIASRIKEACPNGVHVFYDNVGGPLLDMVMANLGRGARVVICGAISQYNASEMYGPKNYMKIVTARGYITGIIVFDYINEYPRAVKEMSEWIAEGKLKTKEHIIEGLSNFPKTLQMLFSGENFGKLLLKI